MANADLTNLPDRVWDMANSRWVYPRDLEAALYELNRLAEMFYDGDGPHFIRKPPGLLDRVKAAEKRVEDNRAPRSIPADATSDVDLVLAEVRYALDGKWPPFWVAEISAAQGSKERK